MSATDKDEYQIIEVKDQRLRSSVQLAFGTSHACIYVVNFYTKPIQDLQFAVNEFAE